MSELQEKPKKDDSQITIRQSLGCLGMMAFVCFGIFALLIMYLFSYSRILQSSLSPQLIPTAESLLNVPHDIITDDFNLYLEVIENYGAISASNSADTDLTCVTAAINYGLYRGSRLSASLYINGTVVMDAGDWILEGDPNMGNTPYPRWCAYGELETGLHLVEIQLNDSFTGEPIYFQQWAIQIDN